MVDVLVFGPHPDDIEICAGGLILAQIAQGRTVGGIDLTAGESGTRGTREQRAAEAKQGAARLGLSFRECLGLRDGGITNDEHARDLVIDAIRRHRPGLVVAPAMFDHHPDHSRTGVIVKEARFLAGCSNIGPTTSSPWRPGRVLFYPSREVAEPSLVVDITEHFDAKLDAIAAHESQLYDPSSDEPATTIASAGFLDMITARATYWGSLIGVARGEAYVVEGPLAVSDPMPAVRDPGQSVFL